ncbi:tetratricopeptide repeat protein [Algiphilus sp.]|uniref:tetratricopeptide repeat protein n=1 Tax=Algiphilus sp. TaxID=1872431 RepID=UPI003B5230CC
MSCTTRSLNLRRALVWLAGGILLLTSGGCATLPGQVPTEESRHERLNDALSARVAEATPVPDPKRATFTEQLLIAELASARGQHETAALAFLRAAALYNEPDIARRGVREALAAGREDLAYELAQLWQDTGDSPSQSHALLLRLAVDAGDAEMARRHLEQVVQSAQDEGAPGYRPVVRALGDVQQAHSLALDVVQTHIEQISRDDPEAWFALGLLAYNYERFDRARAAIERAVALDAPEIENRHLLLLAGTLLRGSDAASAIDAVESRINTVEEPVALRRDFAQLLRQNGAFAEARSQLEALLAAEPGDADALLSLGTIAREQGDPSAAEDYLQRALAAEEGDRAEISYQLGVLAQSRGERDAARQWFNTAAEAGDLLRAELRLAQIDAESGDLTAARERLDRLRRENPGMAARLLAAEGEMLYRAGAFEEAVSLLEQALSAYPDHSELRYNYALALEQAGRMDAAERVLRALIDEDADNAAALNALGYMLAIRGQRLQEAERFIRRALAIAPDDPAIIDSLGWVLFKQGQPKEALAYLERAYATYPNPEVAAHLGEVLWVLGERERARTLLEAALAEHPNDATLQETTQRLLQ